MTRPLDLACPECGHRWKKRETQLQPEQGDLTICDGCGRVLRFLRRLFTDVLYLAPLTARDEQKIRDAMRSMQRDLTPAS